MSKDSGVVNIHGKQYQTVALRVSKFRDAHTITDGWSITAEIVSMDEAGVVVKASIANPDGVVVATGYADERRSASKINRTSALENGETSAIGRALAAAGFGGTEYATADEVAGAMRAQNRRQEPAQRRPDPAPTQKPAGPEPDGNGGYRGVKPHKAALDDKGHHPSWDKDRPGFHARLSDIISGTGWKYADVAVWCERQSKAGIRPSAMSSEQRKHLLDFLATDKGRDNFIKFMTE